MKRIHFHLGTGINGADHDEIVEFEDDATDKEIDDALHDWMANYLDAGWWPADEDEE